MQGFGAFASAARFGRAHDEVRAYLCSRRMRETVSLAERRR
jgi:hypothetical protein